MSNADVDPMIVALGQCSFDDVTGEDGDETPPSFADFNFFDAPIDVVAESSLDPSDDAAHLFEQARLTTVYEALAPPTLAQSLCRHERRMTGAELRLLIVRTTGTMTPRMASYANETCAAYCAECCAFLGG